ncbi:MAG TPA: T9SS type A sorting domain-containing protein [Fluviicola sp.]|nr:T9SS type A sorting domain-containing protein [Fluviicola sp.]
MRYSKLLSAFLLVSSSAVFAQSRLILNNNAFVVIDNNAKVVIENPATNAVTTMGTGGNIVTESEFDQVYWNIGTSTGTYVMPFTSQTTFTKIPFTANITAAGTGAGVVRFSTYPGPTWDNNTYRPSDVTHMWDYYSASFNNSLHVVDRFWIIDAAGYGTKPTATFQFTYRDVEHTAVGNTIVESDLGAQRFNSSTNHWGDYLPQGTTNTVANTTSNVPVSPANFFRSWTLSEITFPLAAEIAYFKSSCTGDALVLQWQTLSESGLDHFEIEHLQNGQYAVIGFVQPTGNGSGVENYSFTSTVNREGIFQLVEVDTDGNRLVKSTISASCVATDNVIVSYSNGGITMSFDGAAESVEDLQIFDAAGRLVYNSDLSISNGANTVVIPDLNLSHGMYMVRLKNGLNFISEKVVAAE